MMDPLGDVRGVALPGVHQTGAGTAYALWVLRTDSSTAAAKGSDSCTGP